jgi:DNA-binding CsgD family transcriptional regulator
MSDSPKIQSDGLSLCFLGFGLYWAWVFLTFDHGLLHDDLLFEGVSTALMIHLLSLLATLPTFLVASCALRLFRRVLQNRLASIVVIITMMAGTLLVSAPFFATNPTLVLTGAVMTGLTSPLLLLKCAEHYTALTTKDSILQTAFAFLIAELIFLTTTFLPIIPLVLVSVILPPAAMAALALNSRPAQRVQTFGENRPHDFSLKALLGVMPPRMMFGFLVVMFAYGGAQAYLSTQNFEQPGDVIIRVLPLLVVATGLLLFGFFSRKNELNLGVPFRLTLLIIAAIFIPLALLGSSFAEASSFFAELGVNALMILTWILLTYTAHIQRLPAFAVFAAGFIFLHVGMALGEIIGLLMIDHLLIFAVIVFCALIVLAGFAFTDRDSTIVFEPPTSKELNEIAATTNSLPATLETIAENYGLSPREKEVFTLWVTGYGSKAIQQKLSISHSTVQTHIHHIYDKCAIHSRNEMISLLEKTAHCKPVT